VLRQQILPSKISEFPEHREIYSHFDIRALSFPVDADFVANPDFLFILIVRTVRVYKFLFILILRTVRVYKFLLCLTLYRPQ
jgi:hypothetical protein